MSNLSRKTVRKTISNSQPACTLFCVETNDGECYSTNDAVVASMLALLCELADELSWAMLPAWAPSLAE